MGHTLTAKALIKSDRLGLVRTDRALITARRSRPKEAAVETDHELFGFLTGEPTTVVAPIHAKTMSDILTPPGKVD